MKYAKFKWVLCLALVILLCLCGCRENDTGASVMIEGDLPYYAAMSLEERAEKCLDRLVQVSGTVSFVGKGILYIGDRLENGITVVCYLADSSASDRVRVGDYATVRGMCEACEEGDISLFSSRLIGTANFTPFETEEKTDGVTSAVPDDSQDGGSTDNGDCDLVWIPQKGGSKYHTKENCSNMKDPEQVTKEVAEAKGYSACSRCH
jgi:hypothetical protein